MLSPEIVPLVVELDVAGSVVGTDERSHARPELAHTTSLGALDERDVARAVALRPALALALDRDAERRFAAALSARHVGVELLDPRSMDGVVAAIRRVGAAAGRTERAQAAAARMLRDIAAIAVARDGKPRRTIVWVVERDPLTVVGADGLLHQLLELAGAENAVHRGTGERVVVGAADLAALRYDAIVDTTSDAAALAGAHGPVLRVSADVAALPAFDVARRVHLLHERLYPVPASETTGRVTPAPR